MIRYIKIVLAALALYAGPAGAQQVVTNWSAALPIKSSQEVVRLIGQDEEGFFVLSARSHTFSSAKYFLDKYDTKYNLLFSRELDLQNPEGKDLEVESVMMIEDQIYLFTSYYSRKADKNLAYATRLDRKGNPVGKTIQIDQISSDKKKNAGWFNFLLSPDSTRLLVYHVEPYDKNDNARFALKVLDRNLDVVWQRNCKTVYSFRDFSLQGATVAGNDRVYILGRVQKGSREERKGRPTYSYTVLAYAGSEEEEGENAEADEYLVSLGSRFITDITFQLDKDYNLTCAGLYSNENAEDAAGTFYLKINGETKEVQHKSIKEFSPEMRRQFMTRRQADRGDELGGFVVRGLITRDDSSSLLLAEQYFQYVQYYTDARGRTYAVYVYEYNDVLAVSINTRGDIEWVTRVPKYQLSTNDGGYYSGFAAVVSDNGNDLYLIFNDHRDNLKPGADKIDPRPLNLKKSAVALVVVDRQGNTEKAQLLDTKAKRMYLRPKVYLAAQNNTLLLYGRSKNKQFFGQVQIEQETH